MFNGNEYTKEDAEYYKIFETRNFVKEQMMLYILYLKNKKNGIKCDNPIKQEMPFDDLQKFCRQLFRVHHKENLIDFISGLLIEILKETEYFKIK
jgi:hypothetical protein